MLSRLTLSRYFCTQITPTSLTLTTPNRINREVDHFFSNFNKNFQTSEDLIRRYSQAEGQLTDNIISETMQSLVLRNVKLDQQFHENFVPILTKYVRLFNSENSEAFVEVVVSAGELGIQDGEFWRAVKETLVINRMDKFIETCRIGDVIKSFAVVGQADENILGLLGDQVIKHKRFIGEESKSTAKQGFMIAEIGFAEFKRALDEDDENELAERD